MLIELEVIPENTASTPRLIYVLATEVKRVENRDETLPVDEGSLVPHCTVVMQDGTSYGCMDEPLSVVNHVNELTIVE